MKKLNNNEVKRKELDILDYINDICQKNNLQYYLAWGTLLGAVRHKGFIPWDDDIDIIMFRNDYEKLKTLIQIDESNYRILSYDRNENYSYSFIKVIDKNTKLIENNGNELGVFVDVFPLDYVSENKLNRIYSQKKCWILRQILGHALIWENHKYEIDRGIIFKIICMACSIYGWKKAIKKLDKEAGKLRNTKTSLVAELVDSAIPKNDIPSRWFKEIIYMDFEGKQYPCPGDFHNYLTYCYGEYMELPPAEKRISNHNFIAYEISDL